MSFGLKGKIISSILVIGAIPLLLGMYFAYRQGTEQLEAVIGGSFEALSTETADKIDMVVNEEIARHVQFVSNSLLISLVRDQLVEQNARYDALDDQGVETLLLTIENQWKAGEGRIVRTITGGNVADLLRRLLASLDREGTMTESGSTQALFITDAHGALLASINRYPDYANGRMSWWKHASRGGRGRVHVGDLELDPKLNDYVIRLSIPILDLTQTNVLGILHRVYDAHDYFERHVYQTRFGETGHVMLIDSEGIVISCPILPTGATVDDRDLVRRSTQGHAGWVKAQSDAHGGEDISILGFAPLKGVNLMMEQLGTRQWHTMAWQSSEELFAPMRNLLTWIAFAGISAMGLLGLLGFYAASRIVTPIQRLQEGAARIARGELHEPIVIKTGDEIERLADEFNSMSVQLQKAFSGLEEKVEEKTREVIHLKEYNEKILMSVPDPIVILTDDGTIEYVNLAFETTFHLNSADVAGQYLFTVLPGDRAGIERVRSELSRLVCEDGAGQTRESPPHVFPKAVADPLDPSNDRRNEPSESREVTIANRVFHCDCFRIVAPGADTVRIGLIMRDITEQRRLREDLIRAEKMAGLGTLTAGIAHELNNPLFGIMGLAEIIRDNDDPEHTRQHAADIVTHARHVASIIKNFAGYVRKGGTDELVPVDVNEKLDASYEMAGMGMVTDDVRLERHYQAVPPIMARPDEIQQVFVNIIKNGIQAMKGKGVLQLSSSLHNGFVAVAIKDSGPGIPKEYASRLFDPFFTTKDQGEGMGLGLTIVYTIVNKYGGEVSFDTKEGEGTTFYIKFPAAS